MEHVGFVRIARLAAGRAKIVAPLLLSSTLATGCFNPEDSDLPASGTSGGGQDTGVGTDGTPGSDDSAPDTGQSASSGDDGTDPCDPSPCLNAGACEASGDAATCVCPDGFSGDLCEIEDAAPCEPDPCVNGTCIVDRGEGSCECDSGWEGDTCEDDIDDCMNTPCLNGGTCSDEGVDTFACDCMDGFEGTVCETNIDDCMPDPCNGNPCVDFIEDFLCNCGAGFSGDFCECSAAAQTQVNYSNQGSFTAPALYDNPPGVTVTGSNSVNVLNLNGLGIVGGVSNNTIDGTEFITFAFDNPSAATSYFVPSAGNQNGDGFVGAAFLEAFDGMGGSLGVVPVNGTGTFNVHALLGIMGPIDSFRVTANIDNLRIGSVTASPIVCVR